MIKKLKTVFIFIISMLWIVSSLLAQNKSTVRSSVPVRIGMYDPAVDAKVEALLRKMTLEEKVGQLVQYSAGQPTGPGTGRTDYEDMIARGQLGSMFNVREPAEIN